MRWSIVSKSYELNSIEARPPRKSLLISVCRSRTGRAMLGARRGEAMRSATRFLSAIFFAFTVCAGHSAHAQEDSWGNTDRELRSVTVEGGPILTRHFQSGSDNFVNHHELAIAKASTQDY